MLTCQVGWQNDASVSRNRIDSSRCGRVIALQVSSINNQLGRCLASLKRRHLDELGTLVR
jgi:hypothetical protein